MKFAAATFALALLFVAASNLPAGAAEKTSDQFHADANVVLINATVLDRHDRPVRGLTRDHFRVFEDKVEQRISYFSEEEVPVSLAVIFDVSGSMHNKMAGMRSALGSVLQSANPQDEFSLVTFADAPHVVVGWNSNADEIQNRLLSESAHGQTSLLDALSTGLAMMKKASHQRKAMLIFSDGGDNHSRWTERQLMQSLAEAGVQIYAIEGSEPSMAPVDPPEIMEGQGLLQRICDDAGGRYFKVQDKRDLAAAEQWISQEMRLQYLIGYVPASNAQDGRFHHVRVDVKRDEGTPKMSVFWRRSYRATGD
jgi:Ca-activated chloride channel family protein